uniref:Uncharacterized protein n=1 Tax=Arundo donax TaxID=35708 RepID=A0A0A8YLL6_ARUDO
MCEADVRAAVCNLQKRLFAGSFAVRTASNVHVQRGWFCLVLCSCCFVSHKIHSSFKLALLESFFFVVT